MNRIVRSGAVALALACAGCVGYGYPTSGGGHGYPSGGYGPPYGGSPGYGQGGVVRCESRDNRRNYCAADTRGGVRLVRQLSSASCVQGSTWGYDGRGVWVSGGCRGEFAPGGGHRPGRPAGPGYGQGGTVRCESRDNRRNYCAADTRGGVRLVRQLSSASCVQGSTWGYDGRGVWVSAGCRGEFASGGGQAPGRPGHGPDPGSGQIVRCESQNNRHRRCNAAVQRDVQLVRQLSSTRCVQRQNWGWDRGGVWVDGGCRAEFRIR